MYYPYFRGRQNELFCLRELLRDNRLNEHITPVLEPVRFNKALFDTLQDFIEAKRDIALIHNPEVGKFFSEYAQKVREMEEEEDEEKQEQLRKKIEDYKRVLNDTQIIVAYINDRTVTKKIIDGVIDANNCFIINKKEGDYNLYLESGNMLNAKMTFIPKDEDFKDEVVGNVSILENGFQKARRNKDYIENVDEFFSKNHLVYKKRGYQGFADYSMVGEEFEESGFAPAAIAIHIIYFDEKQQLRVHHFVSDSNNSVLDPARKFEEAMRKLIEWEHYSQIKRTKGLDKLVEYYSNGKFPGLGVIKRYSMMHHLELMADYLGEDK